jgi:hypothetical protein
MLSTMAALRVVDPPIALPNYNYSQIWRNSWNDDPAHTWLRQKISDICRRNIASPDLTNGI